MSIPADRRRDGHALAQRRTPVVHATHTRAAHRERGEEATYDDLVMSFDRQLVAVDVECKALERGLTKRDLFEVERAAFALASAWLLAESCAMRILGVRPGIGACRRFARAAITAGSSVVTARFGQALAETSKWAALDPRPMGLRPLRAVLGQLSARVDVRATETRTRPGQAARADCGRGSRVSSARNAWGPR